ncbi:MAG: DJ-1/PfpI family protein [Myxococcota bacterium]
MRSSQAAHRAALAGVPRQCDRYSVFRRLDIFALASKSAWLLSTALCSCTSTAPPNTLPSALTASLNTAASSGAADAATRSQGRIRTAAFVIAPEVFNSELMAPYDVFHHTYYRDKNDYIAPFIVAETRAPIVTFEGLTIVPHFTFEDAPEPDIVVIPSTDGSMERDLKNAAFMRYVRRVVDRAEWVITVCDGAFVLAETGALDGRKATTFPADREKLQQRYPKIDVRTDVRLVVDGKFITSVGGGLSYEPAFYLVERLWDAERVAKNARGLVWPWDLTTVPHLVARQPKIPKKRPPAPASDISGG